MHDIYMFNGDTTMALMTIVEPVALRQFPAGPAPRGWPGLRLGFRPFYLVAALAAVAAMALWPAVFMGRVRVANGLAPTLWHAHEMIFGVVMAVVVGFLFTAGKAWTGLATPRGPALGALVVLWLAGRAASLLAPAWAFALLDGAFLPVVAAVFVRLLVRAGQWRNAPVALMLSLLAAGNLAFHAAALGGDAADALRALLAGLALLIVLESLIGGRVIPAFTRSVNPGLRLHGHRALDVAAIGSSALGMGMWIAELPGAAPVLGVAALLQGARLLGWKPWVARRRPILWILHLSYAWICVGLALLALAAAGTVARSAGVHALAVGATGGLVLGMITRTARGHTGRPLQASTLEVAAYAALMLAAILRVAAALAPGWFTPLVCSAGVAWIAAFALYLIRFAPWLMSARLDGKDG
jgi:uncharacterized protein involved in response to NO